MFYNYTVVEYSNYQQGAVFRKPQIRLRIGSKEICEILENKYNVKNNKTQDIDFVFPFEQIPNELVRYLIRGFFDADGSVNNYKNLNRFLDIGMVFTSEMFLHQIGTILQNKLGCKYSYYKAKSKNMELYSMRIQRDKFVHSKRPFLIKDLYDFLYADSSISLTRKKIKFENYLNTVLS